MEDLKDKGFDELLDGIMENPFIGIIVIDNMGNVNNVNKTYMELLGLKEEEILNRHILKVTPHSRLPEILKTKEVQLADHWTINDHNMIVFRTPLYKDGKLIGAMEQSLLLNAAGVRIYPKELKDFENVHK